MTQINVTISGPQGSGKTRLLNLILDALEGEAFNVTAYDDGDIEPIYSSYIYCGTPLTEVEIRTIQGEMG